MLNPKSQIPNLKYIYMIILICLYIFFLLLKDFRNSLFLNPQDRINLFFYSKVPRYYSIGLDDNVNYSINFTPDVWILVPGGYGKYRLGGLGKLVDLEKKSEIFKKAISANTASFAHYYFYPVKTEIYFGGKKLGIPGMSEIFFDRSNARMFDRLYLYILFKVKSKYSFKEIGDIKRYQDKHSLLFSAENFFKDYQGYFYRSSYRRENLTVQIRYTKSYKTAQLLSQILEGEGMRVVDIEKQENEEKGCQVIFTKNKTSQTASDLSNFLHCPLKDGKTNLSDIILGLGNIEKDWEIE